jgi:hypothetical protein
MSDHHVDANELALVSDDENNIRVVFPEGDTLSDAQEFLLAALTKVQTEPSFAGYVVQWYRDMLGGSFQSDFDIPTDNGSIN